jgi:hypothetical protein
MKTKDSIILACGNLCIIIGGFLHTTKTAGADLFSGIGGGLLISILITVISNYLTRKHETTTK